MTITPPRTREELARAQLGERLRLATYRMAHLTTDQGSHWVGNQLVPCDCSTSYPPRLFLDTAREYAIRNAYARAHKREQRRIWRNRIIASLVFIGAYAFPIAAYLWIA